MEDGNNIQHQYSTYNAIQRGKRMCVVLSLSVINCEKLLNVMVLNKDMLRKEYAGNNSAEEGSIANFT